MSPDTPVPSQQFHMRLTRVEDAVQEFRFVHLVKTESQTTGLGSLYAQQRRIQEELSGFRAEMTAEMESVHSELATVQTEITTVRSELADIRDEQRRQGEVLAEVLRRLS